MTAVLYTGGTGRMGTVLREGLAGEFERVVLFTRQPVEASHPAEEVVVGELDDVPSLTAAARGVDVIVHLAGIADEAEWPQILKSNIDGTYGVFESARRAGVRRVVYASSNHVIGFYPTDMRVDTTDPVRPDTYYGVSKVFGEGLARLYHDKWGLEVVALRIGSFRPSPEDERQLSTWLSHRDGVQLLRRAVLAPDVGFVIAYGVSANTRGWWDHDAASELGYQPEDDAERFAAQVQPAGEPLRRHGGVFADPEYRGGSW